MADWKVIMDEVEIFPHPNADKLEIVKVGKFQAIAQKGLHQNGDLVVFAPEKSILPSELAEGFRNYLRGPDNNRVGSIRLRGELSMGVIIPLEEAIKYSSVSKFPQGQDISDLLDITKYEPPIPIELSGDVESLPYGHYTYHDVEGFHAYADEFSPDEPCIVTEKLHGSQGIFVLTPDGKEIVSSKGLFKKGLSLKNSESNTYWRAARNSKIFGMATLLQDANLRSGEKAQISIYGEVIPVQGGNWTYGVDAPEVRIFEVRIDGFTQDILGSDAEFAKAILKRWVPILHQGIPFSEIDIEEVRRGKELVSGKSLHIREGVVIRPSYDRRASDGTRLLIKAINPKYKETGEEFS